MAREGRSLSPIQIRYLFPSCAHVRRLATFAPSHLTVYLVLEALPAFACVSIRVVLRLVTLTKCVRTLWESVKARKASE